jgi:hypothetical protein
MSDVDFAAGAVIIDKVLIKKIVLFDLCMHSIYIARCIKKYGVTTFKFY